MSGRSLSNSVRERLFSDDGGFVLSDALIALLIVGILSILVESTVHTLDRSRTGIRESALESEEQYEDMMKGIGECICEEEPESEEEIQPEEPEWDMS